MFKTKCNDFLDAISKMREEAIEKSVKEAIETEHQPYVAELTKAKQLLVVEETRKTEEEIKKLQDNLKVKLAAYEQTTQEAIAEDKIKVEKNARKVASAKYDEFILGVSKLVDETQIN